MPDFIPVTEALLDECARIYVETFNAEPWKDAWEPVSARQRLSDLLQAPGFFGLAMVEDGRLLGAAFGHVERWYQGSMYYLREMFIVQQLRGRGLGGQLLARMERELNPLGVHTVYLFTAHGDPTEGFYRKHGYGVLDDMRMMTKELV